METENKELLAGYWQKALIVLGALLIILGLCSGFLLSIKGSGLPFCICMAGFEYLRIALDNSQFHSFIDKSFRKKMDTYFDCSYCLVGYLCHRTERLFVVLSFVSIGSCFCGTYYRCCL